MVHRLKKPTLKACLLSGEGTIGVPEEWKTYDRILRLDLLKDWIYELELEYDRTLEEKKK